MNSALKRIVWASAITLLAVFAAATFASMRFWRAIHVDPCPTPQKQIAETGLDRSNTHARAIFDEFGTNGESFYPELHELESFPALKDLTRRLGAYSVVILEPRRSGEPEHLRIRCGNHFNCHFIYVFDPQISVDANSPMFQGWQRITNNVFLKM